MKGFAISNRIVPNVTRAKFFLPENVVVFFGENGTGFVSRGPAGHMQATEFRVNTDSSQLFKTEYFSADVHFETVSFETFIPHIYRGSFAL